MTKVYVVSHFMSIVHPAQYVCELNDKSAMLQSAVHNEMTVRKDSQSFWTELFYWLPSTRCWFLLLQFNLELLDALNTETYILFPL